MSNPVRLAAGLLFLSALAHGDVLYAKQGGRAIVKNVRVVEEKDGKVYYQDKSLKTRSFPKSAIGRVEKKSSDIHVFFERFEAAKTADAVMAIVPWAEKKRFKAAAFQKLYDAALALDKNHAGANQAIGKVLYDGEWMTPEEAAKRTSGKEEAAMRAKGLVRWKDQWVTPADKANLDKGLRKYRGRWMTEDQIKSAEGFVKHEGRWIRKEDLEVQKLLGPARKQTGLGARLLLVQGLHYAVMGDLPPEQLQDIAKTLERLYKEWLRLFPDTPDDILPGKHKVFVFRKAPPYQRYVRAHYDALLKSGTQSDRFMAIEKKRMALRLKETNFWEISPSGMTVHVLMPDPFEALRSRAVHYAANVLVSRYQRTRFTTWWLNESIAYYFEKKVTGMIQTYSVDVGGGKYAKMGPGETNKSIPWLDSSKWGSLLKGLIAQNKVPTLDRMKSKDLFTNKNRLVIQDLAKGTTVVQMLIRSDPKKFAAFVKEAKIGAGSDAVEREVAAVIKHYGNYRKLDQRWLQYAQSGFRGGG